ncbi:hypothetical protein [Streptomyces sp. NPDC048663]|uniref:hypothetical protein n=1 Tax=Streptomyces sp. NPDC048663 TaxID=3155638 RepID=UPI003439E61D
MTTPTPSTENHDLRQLLAVVLDALTPPYETPDFPRRLEDRAGWAATTIKAALADNPADIGWNADFLRGRLAAEQADAEARAVRASVDAQFPVIAAFLAAERGEGQ